MRKLIFCLTILFGVLPISGCHHATPTPPSNGTPTVDQPNPTIVGIIKITTSEGVNFGLSQVAKADNGKNRDQIVAVATHVRGIISDTVIPYLDGNGNVSSAVVNSILKEQLFADSVPAEVQQFITLAASILDLYVPVPDVNTALTVAQKAYVRSFFVGLISGCDSFLTNQPAKKSRLATKPGNWLNPKKVY